MYAISEEFRGCTRTRSLLVLTAGLGVTLTGRRRYLGDGDVSSTSGGRTCFLGRPEVLPRTDGRTWYLGWSSEPKTGERRTAIRDLNPL